VKGKESACFVRNDGVAGWARKNEEGFHRKARDGEAVRSAEADEQARGISRCARNDGRWTGKKKSRLASFGMTVGAEKEEMERAGTDSALGASWRQRHFYEREASWQGGGDLGCYLYFIFANNGPDIRAEHNQREAPAPEVLLMADVLIGGNEHVEEGGFRSLQKFAVLQLWGPVHFDDGANFVVGQEETDADGNVVIKENAQRDGSLRTRELRGFDPAGPEIVPRYLRQSVRDRSCR
jgi:hypothetical protein